MVEIPEGPFAMGSDGGQALEDERPKHQVWLSTFFMDLHEVTTEQYALFLSAIHRVAPWQWNMVDLLQHGDRPVIGVDWADAEAYCRWKEAAAYRSGMGEVGQRNGWASVSLGQSAPN